MIRSHFPIIKERYHAKKSINNTFIPAKNLLENISTDAVNENIFNEPVIRNTFVRLISFIEPWIYLRTNIKLINNDLLPLYDDEKIEVIFKGENVINFYFNQVENRYHEPHSVFDNLLNTFNDNKDFFDKYAKYFRSSHFAFDLNIKTNSSNRFEILEKYVIDSLTEILNIITDGFDALYDFSDDLKSLELIFNQTMKNEQFNLIIDYSSEKLNRVKKLMAIPYFTYSSQLLFNPTSQLQKNARDTNYHIFDQITYEFSNLNNETNNLIFYPYIYYFTKLSSKSNKFTMSDYGFENAIKNEINKQFLILANYNFYNLKRKTNMIKSIVNRINDLPDKVVYDIINDDLTIKDESYYHQIHIPRILNISNVEITPSQSYYVYNNLENNNTDVINSLSSKKHYVIIDQSYSEATRNNSFIIDYDLIRVKLNILLRNILRENRPGNYKIPSEFLDIYITRINSSRYDEIINTEYILFDISTNTSSAFVKIYTQKTLIHNLIRTLFDEKHFLPWYVEKYQRRLLKLLFIINLDESNHLDFIQKLLNTPNLTNVVEHLVFFENDFESYSFYNLVWIDPIFLKKHYEIEYIIKFILIMEELMKLPDDKANSVLKIFQDSYGWDENDIDIKEIRISYTEFKRQLNNIINQIQNINAIEEDY